MIEYFVGGPFLFNCLCLILSTFVLEILLDYRILIYVNMWEYLIIAEYKSSLAM